MAFYFHNIIVNILGEGWFNGFYLFLNTLKCALYCNTQIKHYSA